MTSILSICLCLPLPLICIRLLRWERTFHLFKWNPTYRRGFLLILTYSVCTFLYSAAERSLNGINSPIPVINSILTLVSIGLSLTGILRFRLFQRRVDTHPLLMMTERVGRYGVPDLAVSYLSKERRSDRLYHGSSELHEEYPAYSHGFLLSDLRPGTVSRYNIEPAGFEGSCRMPRDNPVIAISSDAHIGSAYAQEDHTVSILEQVGTSADLFINLGDSAEMGQDERNHARVTELYQGHLAGIPVIQVAGNHDTWLGGISRWQEVFEPEVLKSSSPPLNHHYRPSNTIDIISLDLEWGAEPCSDNIMGWLIEELSSIPADHLVIIVSHAFFFASGTIVDSRDWFDPEEMIERFHPLFTEHGVDLVFSGHNHQFEHLHKDGIDYLVVGTMGGALEKQTTQMSDQSVFLDTTHHGHCRLEIGSDTCRISFIDTQGNEIYVISHDYHSLSD